MLCIIGYITKLSIDYSKIRTDSQNNKNFVEKLQSENKELAMKVATHETLINNLKNRTEEDRKGDAEKFNELYNSRNKTQDAIIELTTTVKMMCSNFDKQFENLDKKIDEINRKTK